MTLANTRLLSQHLVAPLHKSPSDVVSWMGMIQAQDSRMMRWAVGMRMQRPSMKRFREAYDRGDIVRTHLFRCTWQLVAKEDLRWMLSLCADRNRATLNSYLSAYGRTVSEQQFERANQLIQQIVSSSGIIKKSELTARLAREGVTDDAHTISIYLRRAECDGIVCSGTLDERENTYALISERTPDTPLPSREEALSLLAIRYFRSHAPATLADFVWWTSLPLSECRAAIHAIHDELTEEQYQGETYYIHKDSRTRGCRPTALLVPAYDEYLIGYKSRHLVLDNAYRQRAFSTNGLFRPIVVSNGQVVGNWHPKQLGQADFFREEQTADTSEAFQRYSLFVKG